MRNDYVVTEQMNLINGINILGHEITAFESESCNFM
jgi:hypothetical protein